MARWQFKGKTPWSVKIVLPLFIAVIWLDVALFWGISEWSPTVPDSVHSSPMRFMDGVTYFVRPSLAQVLHDLHWLAAGLGVACLLLFLLHRDELERTS